MKTPISSFRQKKFHIMKKLSGVSSIRHILLLMMLLCGIGQAAFAQFQSVIGFPYPAREGSPGGIVLPAGGYAIPASNFDHPNSMFGPGNSDWEIVLINPGGNVASPSKWIGRPSTENVAWMELSACNGQNNYIVAGNDDGDMTLTLTDLAGNPLPTFIKKTGTTANVETAACVKVDGGGNFILVGTQLDVNTGKQNVVAVKVDCNGTMLWNFVYSFPGWSAEAASVTAFSTFIGVCPQPNTNKYYITGKMTPLAGGDNQVFLLSIDATTGSMNYMYRYDINPGASDAGTCIQSTCLNTAQPEIWISGYSYDASANTTTAMMLKTDINGIPIWANNYDIPNGDEFATHFTFGPGDKLIVTGKAEESVVFQGTKGGHCMLMRIDGSGNTVDWTRLFSNGFSSQGNRVEPASNGAYFVTGQSLELLSPSQSANNILAMLTDNNGQTDPGCFNNLTTTVISRPPMYTTFSPAQLTLLTLDFFNSSGLDVVNYTDQQTKCASSQCVCDFTYTTGNCFLVNFTASCVPSSAAYTYEWDIDCDGPEATTPTPNYSHTFFCDAGVHNVCLKVYLNGMLCSSVTHAVTVPNTCCGPILTKTADCTPINNTYRFAIELGNVPGAASCQQPVVTINSAVATLSNLIYVNNPNSWTVTGFAQVATSTTTSLTFTVQSTCLCPVTGLPMTCTQLVNIPLPCCKLLLVDDQNICADANTFDVPIQIGWSPLNNIQLVTWYLIPKPPGGCPPTPWGGMAYQNTYNGNLEPLHIFPGSLPFGDYCVYAVVHLNDGPCQVLTSNIATLTLCMPNSCSLNGYDYCYTGTPVPVGPLNLTQVSPASACPVTGIEWYDPQGNHVQTGGYSYTPVPISMQNDQLCYEDYFYTVEITDACGIHTCKARIRLYSGQASIGSIAMTPNSPPFLCHNGSTTLTFTPECAGDPPKWDWYQQNCNGGSLMPLPDAGTINSTLNTGQLDQSYFFIVEASNGNGVCPSKQVPFLVPVKSPLAYNNFSASSDPCVEQFVNLTLDITPCTIDGCGTPCNCTYTVDWYKDGNYIGTTANVTPPTLATFNYTSTTKPLYGNYYAVLKSDCCPGEMVTTYPIFFRQACEPLIMGPCFICDNQTVQLMAQMVLPPDHPCPDICIFSWFSYDPVTQTEAPLGGGPVWNTSTGGFFILESDCYGCIKRDTFELIECYSNPCRRAVRIEELFAGKDRLMRFYPNPATDHITVEWLSDAPKNAQILITDPDGRILSTVAVPDASKQLTLQVDDLPSGIFFVKVQSADRMYTAAKLIKE